MMLNSISWCLQVTLRIVLIMVVHTVANLIKPLRTYITSLESYSGQFSSQYNSRLVIYDRRGFMRWATGKVCEQI